MTLILKSIEEEAAACRERCANLKIGDDVLHLHHEVFTEKLTEPLENRIRYILENKTDNVALRLRMISPVLLDDEVFAAADWQKADAALKKADAALKKADADWMKARADSNAGIIALYFSDWRKAYTDRMKARADWKKAYLPHYRRLFPESPWDGFTIFTEFTIFAWKG